MRSCFSRLVFDRPVLRLTGISAFASSHCVLLFLLSHAPYHYSRFSVINNSVDYYNYENGHCKSTFYTERYIEVIQIQIVLRFHSMDVTYQCPTSGH